MLDNGLDHAVSVFRVEMRFPTGKDIRELRILVTQQFLATRRIPNFGIGTVPRLAFGERVPKPFFGAAHGQVKSINTLAQLLFNARGVRSPLHSSCSDLQTYVQRAFVERIDNVIVGASIEECLQITIFLGISYDEYDRLLPWVMYT